MKKAKNLTISKLDYFLSWLKEEQSAINSSQLKIFIYILYSIYYYQNKQITKYLYKRYLISKLKKKRNLKLKRF